MPHHNVVRLVAMTGGWFDVGPGDVWTLFHSYAFDFSVWEMWGALATGAGWSWFRIWSAGQLRSSGSCWRRSG